VGVPIHGKVFLLASNVSSKAISGEWEMDHRLKSRKTIGYQEVIT
jgi:hypothetical protein